MPAWALAILILFGVLAAGVLAGALRPSPLRTPGGNLLYSLGTLYVRLVHRLRVEGREHLPPAGERLGPLVVVCNHTAGIDPLLVSAASPFPIRWVMAQDMRLPALGWFWRWQRIIFVSRDGGGRTGVREALRHLEAGGVLGIFPESRIERPEGQILPFHSGVGMLVKKSGARVLPVWISGTPHAATAWGSLWRPSRSRVRFGAILRPETAEAGPAEVAGELRGRFLSWTGWPANDRQRPRTRTPR